MNVSNCSKVCLWDSADGRCVDSALSGYVHSSIVPHVRSLTRLGRSGSFAFKQCFRSDRSNCEAAATDSSAWATTRRSRCWTRTTSNSSSPSAAAWSPTGSAPSPSSAPRRLRSANRLPPPPPASLLPLVLLLVGTRQDERNLRLLRSDRCEVALRFLRYCYRNLTSGNGQDMVPDGSREAS